MNYETDVIAVVKTVLKHKGLPDANVQLSSVLYDGGLGLDSLSAAELSVALEKALGKDPYTNGELPQTVGEIVEFYASAE